MRKTRQAVSELQLIWLAAWESSWQKRLAGRLQENLMSLKSVSKLSKSTLAQMVFCIDTRSEPIRRHIEAKGQYETFGYAGFFGIATNYCDPASGLIRKSCPPILDSAYMITESALKEKSAELAQYQQQKNYQGFISFLSQRLKNMLPSAFGYVEGTGLFYGFSLIRRTFFPSVAKSRTDKSADQYENSCVPQLKKNQGDYTEDGIKLKERALIVKTAFDLLGWKEFAPLVIFAGHAGQSANNPFKSSLDCGACAASPGRHNARMLAELANQADVRTFLKSDCGISIPAGTFFVGAEHNTATDELVIFDSEAPASHLSMLKQIKQDLADVQRIATSERLGSLNGLDAARKKASNWAETRPEWGLAGNAGFIVAPRDLTRGMNLEGKCFLHSYDWEADEQGLFLEMIMQGPMVVTQWINNHYYFSTVDNERFGGGSKITHNVTGNFGVVQGNGGDLKSGLPLQSVNSSDNIIYHHPLRLSVLIQAPVSRIAEILLRNDHIKNLVDNKWIYLMVMDPLYGNQISLYQYDCSWTVINTEEWSDLLA
ncbi:putative inorganic carbon transporter subunit DabA [Mucilaginibacter sp. P19]|uniref:putative inorganic carbon transporter subunit DabA n=1 Tax=Mucilaginibacter sp. P19 TaxID=3423947 RepID=UPI003D6794AE